MASKEGKKGYTHKQMKKEMMGQQHERAKILDLQKVQISPHQQLEAR